MLSIIDISSNITNNLEQDYFTVLSGNFIYTMLPYEYIKELKIDKSECETYSINISDNITKDICNLLDMTNNKIALYQNKLYICEEINKILIGNYSKEYSLYLLSQILKQKCDIYTCIEKLDIAKFNQLISEEYQNIKYINNILHLPITYCYYYKTIYKNTIVQSILDTMIKQLSNYNYEIHPKFFYDQEYQIKSDQESFNDIYSLINHNLKNNIDLVCKIINIFNLDISNVSFIYTLLRNYKYLDKLIVKLKANYPKEKLIDLILVLNKVNHIENKNIINLEIIKYIIKYDAKISFYYLLENKLIFNLDNLNLDFLKIYFSLSDNNQKNNYLIKALDYNNYYIELEYLLSNTKISNINLVLDKLLLKYPELGKKLYDKYYHKIDYLKTSKILLNILSIQNEDLFNYLIKDISDKEREMLFINIKNEDDNTVYHYICKNNLCLGTKINNNIRNKLGFKPLELTNIINTYYYE